MLSFTRCICLFFLTNYMKQPSLWKNLSVPQMQEMKWDVKKYLIELKFERSHKIKNQIFDFKQLLNISLRFSMHSFAKLLLQKPRVFLEFSYLWLQEILPGLISIICATLMPKMCLRSELNVSQNKTDFFVWFKLMTFTQDTSLSLSLKLAEFIKL